MSFIDYFYLGVCNVRCGRGEHCTIKGCTVFDKPEGKTFFISHRLRGLNANRKFSIGNERIINFRDNSRAMSATTNAEMNSGIAREKKGRKRRRRNKA